MKPVRDLFNSVGARAEMNNTSRTTQSGIPKNDDGLTYDEWLIAAETAALRVDKCHLVEVGSRSGTAWRTGMGPVEYVDSLRAPGDPDQTTGFDKFMDKILISEGGNAAQRATGDSVQRRRAAKHQDRPGNRIRFGSK